MKRCNLFEVVLAGVKVPIIDHPTKNVAGKEHLILIEIGCYSTWRMEIRGMYKF